MALLCHSGRDTNTLFFLVFVLDFTCIHIFLFSNNYICIYKCVLCILTRIFVRLSIYFVTVVWLHFCSTFEEDKTNQTSVPEPGI